MLTQLATKTKLAVWVTILDSNKRSNVKLNTYTYRISKSTVFIHHEYLTKSHWQTKLAARLTILDSNEGQMKIGIGKNKKK